MATTLPLRPISPPTACGWSGGRVADLPAGSFRPDSDGTFRLSLATAQQLGDGRALGVARLPGDRVADAVDVLIVLIG